MDTDIVLYLCCFFVNTRLHIGIVGCMIFTGHSYLEGSCQHMRTHLFYVLMYVVLGASVWRTCACGSACVVFQTLLRFSSCLLMSFSVSVGMAQVMEDEQLWNLCSRALIVDELEMTIPRWLMKRWNPRYVHFLQVRYVTICTLCGTCMVQDLACLAEFRSF